MSENRISKDKVEAIVLKWKRVLRGFDFASGVVASIVNVGNVEAKLGMFRGYVLLTPPYSLGGYVKALVFRVSFQIPCQRLRKPARPTTHFENSVPSPKTS